jgi:hypothetical protein
MPGDFCIPAVEQILHFLAYHNYADQVESMLKLVTENRFDIESETVLSLRLVLCSIGAFMKNEVNTAEDLERVIRQLDEALAGSSAQGLWAEFRHLAVAQVVASMLRKEVGFDATDNSLDEGLMRRFKRRTWLATVKRTFERYDYGNEEEDGEGGGSCTAQAVNDFELLKLQESLADVGDPDKVHLLYIFKQRAWPAFLTSFEAFLRAAQDEVGGLPELLSQHQSIAPSLRGHSSPGGNRVPAQQSPRPAFVRMPLGASKEEEAPQKGPATKPAATKKAAAAKSARAAILDDIHTDEEDEDATEDDDRNYGDDDRSQDEEPETQGNSVRSLRLAARQLTTAMASADPLADVLAESSSRDKTTTLASKGSKTKAPAGSFVGTRETSVPVAFDSIEDSVDDDFQERPSLPKYSMAPMIAPIAPVAAAASPKATHIKRKQDSTNVVVKKVNHKNLISSLVHFRDFLSPSLFSVFSFILPCMSNESSQSHGFFLWRQRQRWTAEEEQLIQDGIDELGHGHWAEIKSKYFRDSIRSQVDIKDKYRNMTK